MPTQMPQRRNRTQAALACEATATFVPSPIPWWQAPWIAALFLGVLTILVFWPATRNEFVYFDDPDYVFNNPMVQDGLTWKAIRWAFTTGHACNWHPLTWISHMLDCQWFGLDPWGHHLIAVLVHGLSTACLFLVLRHLTGAFWPALIAAALFGLHPTRVESVAWVAERKDVLSTFFWIAAMGTYSRWIASRNGRWYAATLGLFALGLLSKPMIVTLPCVLLLLDYWPGHRFARVGFARLLLEKVPFFLLAMISSIITIIVQQQSMSSLDRIPLPSRFTNAIVSYCRYLGQLFWPADLSVYYPRPVQWEWIVWTPAALLILTISAVVWWQREKRPYLLVGWFWYLGSAVPVIGLVQVGTQAMADRYTYIPTIGLLIAVVWGVAELASRWKLPVVAVRIGAAATVIACVALTSRQIAFWKNDETLFRQAVAVTPPAILTYSNLGAALLKDGKFAESIPYLTEVLRLSPDDALARCNYALALLQLGRTWEAIREFDRSRALSSRAPVPDARLGIILLNGGWIDEALPRFEEAVRADPQDAQLHYHLADILKRKTRYEEAILEFREAIRLKPAVPEGYFGLAETLGLLNRKDEAIAAWQQAVKLVPNHSKAHNNLGVALGEAGRLEEAAEHFRTALRLDPKDADAASNLQQAKTALAQFPAP